jgi:hypothetical protein
MSKYIQSVEFEMPQEIIQRVDSYVDNSLPIWDKTVPTKFTRQITRLIVKENLNDLDFPLELLFKDKTLTLTKDVYDDLKRSTLDTLRTFEVDSNTTYNRIQIAGELKSDIINCLPTILQQLSPIPVIQVINGNGVVPHTDFMRMTSMFYLLTESAGWVTSWYEPKDKSTVKEHSMKHGFFWANPDYNDIELKEAVQIPQHKWHVFDNNTYHSVKYSNSEFQIRKAFQIEFRTVTAKGLYKILYP